MVHSEKADRLAGPAAVAVALIAVAVTTWRIFYGVDFVDEALYAAMSYRFAMGTRPFIDLVDVHQMASLLVSPFARLHLLVFGDTTGIMLSLRVLWLALDAGAAALWWIFLSRTVDRRIALLAAVAGFSFIPYMIPAPSFNTLPVLFGSAGLALIGLGLRERARGWLLVAAGVCLGLATFAYQTFVLAAVFAVSGVWWITRSWRPPALVAVGGLVVAAAGAAVLLPFASGIPAVLEFSRDMAPLYGWLGANGIGGKLTRLVTREFEWGAKCFSIYPALVVGALVVARRRVPAWLMLTLVVSLPLATPELSSFTDVRTIMIATSILMAAALSVLPRAEAMPAFADTYPFMRFCLWFGLASGLVFALTSSQGFMFLSLGAIIVMPAAVALLLDRLSEALREEGRVPSPYTVTVMAASVLIVFMAFFNATGYYRDESPQAATMRVAHGPHAGLMTTKFFGSNTEELWSAMQRLSGPDDVILAYHGLPAAYLYTSARPALPNIWSQPYDAMGAPVITQRDLRALSRPGGRPTVVVRNLGLPSDLVFETQNPSGYDPARDGLEAFVRANYTVAEKSAKWQVLVPK